MRKISSTEESLQEIQAKLSKWSDFISELQVPGDIVPAISTGRIELLKLAQPRPLSVEECNVLYKFIGGLLETNQALQQHASLISRMAAEVERTISGVEGVAGRLRAYADFRSPIEGDDE